MFARRQDTRSGRRIAPSLVVRWPSSKPRRDASLHGGSGLLRARQQAGVQAAARQADRHAGQRPPSWRFPSYSKVYLKGAAQIRAGRIQGKNHQTQSASPPGWLPNKGSANSPRRRRPPGKTTRTGSRTAAEQGHGRCRYSADQKGAAATNSIRGRLINAARRHTEIIPL